MRGYWTIFFNVISEIVIIATVDVPGEFLGVMFLFLWVSIVAMAVTGNKWQPLKHAVGAKSFGSLTVALGLFQYYSLPLNWIGLTVLWIVLSGGVYFAWHEYRSRNG